MIPCIYFVVVLVISFSCVCVCILDRKKKLLYLSYSVHSDRKKFGFSFFLDKNKLSSKFLQTKKNFRVTICREIGT